MQVPQDGWFRFVTPVRFRDLDAMGHAHHTLPLVYLEEARAEFWRELTGASSLESIDYVMAEITLRFHARIRYPGDVEVLLGVDHVGGKSFAMPFELRSATSGQLLAKGRSVQVLYDYDRERAKSIERGMRDTLVAWRDALAQNSSAIDADTMPMNAPST
jgi:acyl-CoA thioester hydrolase